MTSQYGLVSRVHAYHKRTWRNLWRSRPLKGMSGETIVTEDGFRAMLGDELEPGIYNIERTTHQETRHGD